MNNNLVPTEFYLGQNYPNPFKDKTIIKYCVADKTRVQITVYDAEGNEIEKLVDEVKEPGTYEVEFSTDHPRGVWNPLAGRQGLPDAYYYYRMTAGDYLSEKKWLCINKLLLLTLTTEHPDYLIIKLLGDSMKSFFFKLFLIITVLVVSGTNSFTQEIGSLRAKFNFNPPTKLNKSTGTPLDAGTYTIGSGGYFATIQDAFN